MQAEQVRLGARRRAILRFTGLKARIDPMTGMRGLPAAGSRIREQAGERSDAGRIAGAVDHIDVRRSVDQPVKCSAFAEDPPAES